jgi:hypothetical protein
MTSVWAIAFGTVAGRASAPSLLRVSAIRRPSTIAAHLLVAQICASEGRSLICDAGENNHEHGWLNGFGHLQLDKLDQFDHRRRRAGLTRPRRFKQGSGAAGNPKLQTEAAREGGRYSAVAPNSLPTSTALPSRLPLTARMAA